MLKNSFFPGLLNKIQTQGGSRWVCIGSLRVSVTALPSKVWLFLEVLGHLATDEDPGAVEARLHRRDG